ncbi:MAG: polysaccharide pyruvyl transferase WcaK-like protein [Oceanospirillaceae bacterium]|jgi:polysaccharide pyruvyl transferase WcaK-like protein
MFKKYDAHIAGYYGMQNSGDDALMYATVWGAKKLLHCESTSIGLYDNNNAGAGSDTVNRANNQPLQVNRQRPLYYKQAFSGQNRLIQYQAAIQSKGVIFGGGSVLHSVSDINLKRHLMMLAGRANSRAVGVSLGPFQSIAAEKSCTDFLNECGFVGVRDQKSFELAQSLAPQANIEKTFDLAPLLLCANKQILSNNSRQGVALSLCPVAVDPSGCVDEKAEKKRLSELCHLLETLYKSTGEAITLLTFNGHDQLGDWKINHDIKACLENKLPITVKAYNPNPFAVLQDLANYKAVISMRLHGSILSYLKNTPVISLNYHEKCQGWCTQIGLAKNYQFNPQCLDVEGIRQQIEQGLEYGFTQSSLIVADALKSALSNWSTSHE